MLSKLKPSTQKWISDMAAAQALERRVWNPEFAQWAPYYRCERQCERHPGCVPTEYECPLLSAACWGGQELAKHALAASAEARVLAAQRREAEVRERLTVAGVPKRFLAAALVTADKTNAMNEAGNFLGGNGIAGGRCLILIGAVGTGKTFAAAALMRDYLESHEGDVGVFQYCAAMINWIRFAEYDARNRNMERVKTVPLLVIDDMACESDTEVAKAILDELIYAREGNERATIITTNKKTKAFKDAFGERIADRLLSGWSSIVQLNEQSLRRR